MKKVVFFIFMAILLNTSANCQDTIISTYNITQGDTLKINLPSNPSTGYSWILTNELQYSFYIDTIGYNYVSNSNGLLGSTGTAIWSFKAYVFGIDTIKLAYCKPFESNSTIETSINIVKISNINNITTTNKDIFLDDTFELQLPSNVTTGFCWIWSNIKYCSHLDTFNHSYIPDTLHVCCGRGGTEIWKFKGINLGTDTIILKYCQPWDTTSTAETQDIIVNVTNKASSLPNQIYDNIKVYPVPAKESLNIEFQNLNYNGYLVEIFNLNGISILNKKVTTSTEFLNLDNLISGSYILVISDNNNVVLRKLISVIK